VVLRGVVAIECVRQVQCGERFDLAARVKHALAARIPDSEGAGAETVELVEVVFAIGIARGAGDFQATECGILLDRSLLQKRVTRVPPTQPIG
jgi:hypothetical protein